MTALVISAVAAAAALWESRSPPAIWRSMFSITTIASSTTRPVARVMPNNVSVLIEKPSNFTKMKVPMSETGVAMK